MYEFCRVCKDTAKAAPMKDGTILIQTLSIYYCLNSSNCLQYLFECQRLILRLILRKELRIPNLVISSNTQHYFFGDVDRLL